MSVRRFVFQVTWTCKLRTIRCLSRNLFMKKRRVRGTEWCKPTLFKTGFSIFFGIFFPFRNEKTESFLQGLLKLNFEIGTEWCGVCTSCLSFLNFIENLLLQISKDSSYREQLTESCHMKQHYATLSMSAQEKINFYSKHALTSLLGHSSYLPSNYSCPLKTSISYISVYLIFLTIHNNIIIVQHSPHEISI